jgi:hypothetical protein
VRCSFDARFSSASQLRSIGASCHRCRKTALRLDYKTEAKRSALEIGTHSRDVARTGAPVVAPMSDAALILDAARLLFRWNPE